MLREAIPVLHVSSSVAAEEFYCDRLGFERLFAYRPIAGDPDPCYLGVARDGAVLHLSSFGGDGVAGNVVFVRVDDVDALHAELVAAGVAIDTPPVDQSWGNREMYVRDADRNSIRFTRPSDDEPLRRLRFRVVAGEWAVVRLGADDAVPTWALAGDRFCSVTRTDDELSVVCPAAVVPADARAERGWAAIALAGPFPFEMVGVLASCAQPLAEVGVSIFVSSTFDTDWLLVKHAQLDAAVVALTRAGHEPVAD
ncbi:MAG: ACT domain-containing protein [Gemmatimonadetes bacterium]|nr:ACT domain-containing protein [Gemmatimonadota bacterium]